MEKRLVYDIHDKPKFSQLMILALQQVLAILAATIAVPTIIGLPTQIPAAILGAGVGTIVYQLFTKFKSPVFLGSSFAFLGSLGVAVAYGYCGIVLGSIVAGLVYVLIAVIIHFAGTNWVDKLMPPVIIGPTVALIGLSLAGSATGDFASGSVKEEVFREVLTLDAQGTVLGKAMESEFVSIASPLIAILCGLITFLTVVICSTQKRYKMPRLVPFILGVVAGYVAAAMFTVIGNAMDVDALKIINFQPVIDNFYAADGTFKGLTAFVDYPRIAIFEGFKELLTGEVSPEILAANKDASVLTLGGIAEVVIAFLPVALVVFAEHIADHKNLSSIIGHDLIKEPGLKRTLLGDGVGSIAGTVFGICPNTTYGESVGCVAITRNASVVTITATAVMCIVLAFLSPVAAALQTIPACVMGGVCFTLYGFIAVSGLKMFENVDLDDNKNLFVVAAILISGIGGLVIQIPYGANKFITITSIATALIIGILTNAILNKLEKSKLGKEKGE